MDKYIQDMIYSQIRQLHILQKTVQESKNLLKQMI